VYEQLNAYYKDKSDYIIRIRIYLPALLRPNNEIIEISNISSASLLSDKKASFILPLSSSRKANYIPDLVTDIEEFGR
jgi:hypothetical protein